MATAQYFLAPDPTYYQYEQQPAYYDSSAFYQQQLNHQSFQQYQQSYDLPPQSLLTNRFPELEPTTTDDTTADPILALNLRVLRRHLPSTLHILYQAQYAVIYTFNPQSTEWEKSGKEGTLFIVQEPSRPGAQNSAALVVLNRRGMDNFVMRDWDPQVQSEGGHIILKGRVEGEAVRGGGGTGAVTAGEESGEGEDLTVWGVWIWEEDGLESTKGKREGVEACLVACTSGETAEEEGPSSEAVVDPDGDGAVFEDQTNPALEDKTANEQQQQQQQHWESQYPEHSSHHLQPQHRHGQQQQHSLNHLIHHPPPPPSQPHLHQNQNQYHQQQPHPRHPHHSQPSFHQPLHPQQQQQQQQQQQVPYQSSYQPTSLPLADPSSPNLMALLNGGAITGVAPQQSAFPSTNHPQQQQQQQAMNGNMNGNAGRDILGEVFTSTGR